MRANPLRWSFRGQFLAGFASCASLLAYALYAQFGMLLMPCPLCILQRIAFAVMGLVFLAGGLHSPRGRGGRAAYGLLVFLPAAAGAGVAGRHVWLQSLPAEDVPLCTSMGLDYMVEAMGMFEALAKVLQGSGECAAIDWTFLGLSMPAWTLVWFVALGGFALWAGFRRR
ncbi:disulfide bond formation protein B [Arenimonas fontis]|uniref:Disulfide bond formation protein B n=1 Tax=Arenimonas fontis TaxID=2608255 RepID=A0A5B2ZCA8_9GAMM|nr:disulfide bond formation protein B [Arenimonas fontis]KAA2286318.1 disulfide bond formation protein B [Arenimonas fontis]